MNDAGELDVIDKRIKKAISNYGISGQLAQLEKRIEQAKIFALMQGMRQTLSRLVSRLYESPKALLSLCIFNALFSLFTTLSSTVAAIVAIPKPMTEDASSAFKWYIASVCMNIVVFILEVAKVCVESNKNKPPETQVHPAPGA